ncbi:alpha-isopropylmalate synthase regulatory domain-containing protein [Maribacter sp. ACAM166]|uniref:alpha-isopropylmalate synthase regulatory domain-containing protein n=1 Tax=Maribacter sp. ACAM166 TaxID=2508996 RepID=UPI0010FE94B4|nr:alpha-isopropylmalate synthase regulatory domain-containing protein [Maribacter sp. ACAM166]TLP72799.1 2-isopropylmalate synthase [Maribacter sp. ACAM166]
MKRKLEIMDTTLRDGEQTSGVSFSASEKLTLAKLLLEELRVDRIEVASARVSDGELEAVQQITEWASTKGYLERVEVLTFVDGGVSLDWMKKAGAISQNLLTKGSLNHLEHQLKKTPKQHFSEISEIFKKASENSIINNIYLEDWSNGMRNSKTYVFEFLDFISTQPVKRILLPDTLGILTYTETFEYISEVVQRYPDLHFDFHGHNDYDLGVANIMEAVKAGCHGLHLTVNGMGERAGNAPMASAVAVINDFLPEIKINVNESSLFKVSKFVSAFTGFTIPANKPIVGDNVFTQTAGIHADGDTKKNLYFSDLMPERFGRKRKYALGKMSGKANIQKNLQELGLTLNDDELKKVTARIIELGDKKERVTQDDLPFIISDVLDTVTHKQKVFVKSYVLTHAKGLMPSTTLSVEIDGKTYEENAQGDGQYDAFMNALKKVYIAKNRTLPKLTDYSVRIPPGSNSDALCETVITWEMDGKEFTSRGLDSDQTVSAIKATEKMLNII